MNNSVRNFSVTNLDCFRNDEKGMTKPMRSHIVQLQIDTLHYQQKELEHNGGQRYVHDTCIVHTAVGKKAHLGEHSNIEQ